MKKEKKGEYFVCTTNVKNPSLPVDIFGLRCLHKSKKGKWTHRW